MKRTLAEDDLNRECSRMTTEAWMKRNVGDVEWVLLWHRKGKGCCREWTKMANLCCGKFSYGEAWLWRSLIMERFGCGEAWLWRSLAMEKHGCGEAWLWKSLAVEKFDCGEAWLWRSLAVEKFGCEEAYLRRSLAMKDSGKHVTRHGFLTAREKLVWWEHHRGCHGD